MNGLFRKLTEVLLVWHYMGSFNCFNPSKFSSLQFFFSCMILLYALFQWNQRMATLG